MRRRLPVLLGLALAGAVLLGAPGRAEDEEVAFPLRVTEDGFLLDLRGRTLRGAPEGTPADRLEGVGILVEHAKGVTVRGGAVAGFKVGIRAVNAPGLVIEDVDASGNFKQRLGSTPEREDAADWLWPHENDDGEWEAKYGAGISLEDCQGAVVRRCRVRGGQNGLLLTRCRACEVYDNDFSFNSGWGIALYRTTHSTVGRNRLDFCVRGYSHGVYYRGQDSAAILVFEQSSNNLFALNSATHSGDGFFLYAGHETTQRTGTGGCNDNLVIGNDFRFAVANGIEATFSEGNVFARNDCSGADHGIWAGYSRKSRFLLNRIADCRTAGISIEHGHDNEIVANGIRGARYGIHLWWDEDEAFLSGPFGEQQDCASTRNLLRGNRLEGTVAALRLAGDVGSLVTDTRFPAPETRIQLLQGTRGTIFRNNVFAEDLVVENRTGEEVVLPDTNVAPGGIRGEGDPVRVVPGTPAATTAGPERPDLPKVPGTLDPRLPPDLPAGPASIRIDEWGPVDPRSTRLFPARQAAPGREAKVHLLGSAAFEVVEAGEGVVVEPTEGTAPATLVVRPKGEGLALRPFRVVVLSAGARHEASGTLLDLPWTVRHVAWDAASDPRTHADVLLRRLEEAPATRVEVDALDFPWKTGGPAGVTSDAFATLATATARLGAGRYRFTITSDDGVRLYVDGKLVLERWDRHAPTKDVVELDLEAGEHDLRIEHFELDGWAWLALGLERLPGTD